MFGTILIANRGEIACRIMRSAQAMGVRCVAVYSDADAQARHVQMADEAVRLGPAPVADSYLRGDLIIQAALDCGAEAIHPGYGFLSENPDFVSAVEAAGLVFIGPSADAIRAMGLKDHAKDLMEQAGVPVVPGYQGENQDDAYLALQAGEIGYPVMIKAVAGGGGKGMRVVVDPKDFLENLVSARSEARKAFGNDTVLIEKYITAPRHIEVQIFGDGTDAIHLFERDCSLQRRHQKVIEEAPAPGMTPQMRAAMGAAAVRAAEAIGYAGAGTVEFIVDAADGLRVDGFWFMEMNTRLQVEHPVTEAITGIDLVAWQLAVAAGRPLPLTQDQIVCSGHAFEARIYAEDVPAGFLPATGTIAHFEIPQNARLDTGVVRGDVISPWYDPMIAKLTCHGPDRAAALQMLRAAIDQTRIAGVVTNLGFLSRLLQHPDVSSGRVHTDLIARDAASLCAQPPPTGHEVAVATVLAAGLDDGPLVGFSLWQPLRHTINLSLGHVAIETQLSVLGPHRCEVTVDGTVIKLNNRGDGWGVPAVRHGASVTVFGKAPQTFQIIDPLDRTADAVAGDTIIAPMPGLIAKIFVVAGADVATGDPVAVLEAMKMEHILRAPRDGRIATVATTEGAQITAGATIATLDAPDV